MTLFLTPIDRTGTRGGCPGCEWYRGPGFPTPWRLLTIRIIDFYTVPASILGGARDFNGNPMGAADCTDVSNQWQYFYPSSVGNDAFLSIDLWKARPGAAVWFSSFNAIMLAICNGSTQYTRSTVYTKDDSTWTSGNSLVFRPVGSSPFNCSTLNTSPTTICTVHDDGSIT